jgi:hypothetical protein
MMGIGRKADGLSVKNIIIKSKDAKTGWSGLIDKPDSIF